jgi:signal transduction histidine kinase
MAQVLTQRDIVSALMVPIIFRGQIIGSVGIHSRQQRDFTTTEIRLAQTVGEELGQSLELLWLNDQLRTHAAELEDRVAERTRELATANERLQELDRLKSKFISDVSHELRTPITNLGMYLDLLEYGQQDKRHHYTDVLRQETKRLQQLVEGILDLSRLETSQERGVQFEKTDLNQIVAQAVDTHLPQAATAGLTLTFTPTPETTLIMGVHNQLSQIVTNLLTNALNYTHEGGIQVETIRKNGQVCLRVQDSGIGIDREDMPHLFDRFYRGQRVGQFNIPGTGLGLAIVKEIVDLHNGQVHVQSDAGQGTTFEVWLPLQSNS